jgi:hypothetical protein
MSGRADPSDADVFKDGFPELPEQESTAAIRKTCHVSNNCLGLQILHQVMLCMSNYSSPGSTVNARRASSRANL